MLYDKPVRQLMWDMVHEMGLQKGQRVSRIHVESWFAARYPKVKKGTIAAHLLLLSTNAPSRVYYGVRREGDDLFFHIDGGFFRLYDPETDPPPIYEAGPHPVRPEPDPTGEEEAGAEFAYESDLRSFLSKNLGLLERGLRLYEEEGVKGIQFPAGGRFIDLLAVDSGGNLVVIELKVSRGYDRTVGQLLRYMGWIDENMAERPQSVRGFIVAREMTQDLLLACRRVPSIHLFEYDLSVTVRIVS